MPEIKCPNCGEVFQIDESNYDSIVKQIRDHEFNEELNRREKEYKEKIESAVALAKADSINSSKDRINELELKINTLNNEITLKDSELKNKVNEAVSNKEKEILELKSRLDLSNSEAKLNEQAIINKYEADINAYKEQIEFYKDFKARLSTKGIGESLEQHCLCEFNKLRATAFKNAYFDKDNEVSKASGSKGDFIFKDFDDEGTEITSIMFEMKNEADTTATKHKNTDFFKELDKDRNEKGCEYAVLVSLLEPESELYNEGIVDVSYAYPKMYVVRPQFFIPIITLIRNASINALGYKKQLIEVQNRDIDITNFENNLDDFKKSFFNSYKNASQRFDDAIKEIDSTIKHLQAVKENLTLSQKHLLTTNNKVEDITIKKLTKNAPSVAEKFDK